MQVARCARSLSGAEGEVKVYYFSGNFARFLSGVEGEVKVYCFSGNFARSLSGAEGEVKVYCFLGDFARSLSGAEGRDTREIKIAAFFTFLALSQPKGPFDFILFP